MSSKKAIAINTAAQMVGKLISSILTFLTTILIARQYGAIGYGEFTKAITFITIFYLVADFGLNAVILKKYNANEDDSVFASLALMRIVWSLLLIFIALAITAFLPFNVQTQEGFTNTAKLAIIILAPSILFQALFQTANAMFQHRLRYDLSVFASSMGSIISLVWILIVVAIKAPLTIMVAGYLAGTIVTGVIALIFVHPSTILKNVSGKQTISLFLEALPLGMTLIINVLYLRADMFILTTYRSTAEVGYYGLAYRLFEVLLALPTFIMNSAYPFLLKNSHYPLISQQKFVKHLWLVMIGIACALMVFAMIAAPMVNYIKSDFQPSILIFRILSFSLPVFFTTSLLMWLLVSRGKYMWLICTYSIGLGFNAVMNSIFTRASGAVPAAIITGVSECMVLLLLLLAINQTWRDQEKGAL